MDSNEISQRFDRIIASIRMPYDIHPLVGVRTNGDFYIYLHCREGFCNVTGKPMDWKSRKWLLSKHMTDGEIVQTCFKALMTALEHEARENFTYKGVSVFDPHYDIDKLVELRRQDDSIKERELV